MLLGMDYTRPPLFQCLELEQKVTVTLRAHVLVIVRVVVVVVSEQNSDFRFSSPLVLDL